MKTILHFARISRQKLKVCGIVAALCFLFLPSYSQDLNAGLLKKNSSSYSQKFCPPQKIKICHKGKNVIEVSMSALLAHLAHGDKIGTCNPAPVPACTVEAKGGVISCSRPSVTLSAVTGNTGASFNWTGPNGFTSTSASPVVTVPGVYTVSVSSANCTTATDTAMVSRDLTAPVVTTTGGIITCDHPLVTISATSSISGSAFSWTGPNGFSSSSPDPSVQVAGTYVVTVRNPSTGCSTTNAAVVQQNISAPVILTVQASGSGMITCSNPSVVLTATTTSTDVRYSWTGPNNFVSDSAMPEVTQPGVYNLELSDIGSGCSSTASIEIMQNTTVPTDVHTTPAVVGTITCAEPDLVLTGGSASMGVAYQWTGPNGFNSTSPVTTASIPGTYTLMVIDTANGCGSQATINVEQNITTPAGVTASNSEPLTCFTTEVSLMGSSSSSSVSYTWSGPEGFSSASPVTTTSVAGIYTLTVTDLFNGCTSSASTTVQQNTNAPADVTASVSGILNCDETTVMLQATSSSTDIDYFWFGPDGFFAPTPEAETQTPGDYLLMVTDRQNGCSEMINLTVEQDLSGCMQMKSRQDAAKKEKAKESTVATVELNVYPNPVQGRGVISFKTPQDGKAALAIYNVNGFMEKILFNQQASANHLYQVTVDTGGFKKGIYFCVLTIGNKQYSKKILMMP